MMFLAREVRGIATDQRHRIETTHARQTELRKDHRAGDAVIAELRPFQLLIQPAAPFPESEGLGTGTEVAFQAPQILDKLHPRGIAQQPFLNLKLRETGKQAIQPAGQAVTP